MDEPFQDPLQDPFDDESVFYTSWQNKPSIHKITEQIGITPTCTPEIYTTSSRPTPANSPDIVNTRNNHYPLTMPDGQVDPFVLWKSDEKRYLFTQGKLLMVENRPTYAIPTDFCHNDNDKAHRIMIYYDLNKSFEKRFGYYDNSNCFCRVEYVPAFSYITNS
jgi:hypothetical protein